MIICPSCNHTNPEGATQCESCYTPLPEMIPCPKCGLSIQTDAIFCGQCGYKLQSETSDSPEETDIPATEVSSPPKAEISHPSADSNSELPSPWDEDEALSPNDGEEIQENTPPPPSMSESPSSEPDLPQPEPMAEVTPPVPDPVPSVPKAMATQLQVQSASLLHLQTQTVIDLPNNLNVIHIGKPNEQIPPDIDVSGFANSEVVSRIHADIRVEGDTYYVEDMGSSNGTYVNHTPLPSGNRHCLRPGDRISLGKGDLVTFIFQR
ncbi:MAG: FHA domain-containing protein [Microcystaceae cyanobacterium]